MDKAPFASSTAQASKPHLILVIAQWVVAAFLAFIVVRSVTEIGGLEKGRSVTSLVWLALGFVAIMALTQIPPLFFRAPLMVRYGIYAASVAALAVLGIQEHQFRNLTPTPLPAGASPWGSGPAYEGATIPNTAAECRNLVGEAIAMSRGERVEIIEINNVKIVSGAQSEDIQCTGDAITSAGQKTIDFGVETTPQGRSIITLNYR